VSTPNDAETRPSRGERELIEGARRQAEDAVRAAGRVSSTDTTTLHISDSKEPLPERIGPYRIQRQLGRGGMGSVLLAIQEDGQFKRRVAIKLLRKGLDTADILRRFDLERQVLAALNHPNIARLLDAGQTDDGRPYFVMEFIEGQALDDYCDSQSLPVDDRLALFRKVCGAVHYAHQNLVVHRDLKPGNIIVTSEGEPKLLDFGIAKLLNPDLMQVSVMTGPALRLMTPEYASPEQVKGEPVGITSDVYSLGVLLYELLSGHRPYKLTTRVEREIVRAICDTDPVPPSNAVGRVEDHVRRDGTTIHVTPESVAKVRGGAPAKLRRRLVGDIDNIVLKAMQKVARRRYSSAEQLSEDIQRHLDGLPIIARPDSRVYRCGKFIRRNRLGVAAVAAIFLALALGLAGTTWQWGVATRARDRAETLRSEAQARAEHLAHVVETTISELRSELRKTEGATAARRLLATAALQIAERLVNESAGDPRTVRALAEMCVLAGDVLGGIRSANQGETAEALASHQRALGLLEALAAETPADREVQIMRVRARTRCADLFGRMNRVAEALELYESAAAAARLAVGLAGSEPDARPYLASALDGAGDQHMALGQRDVAERSYLEAKTVRLAVLEDRPNDTDAQRAATVSVGKLAKLFEDAGRLDDALHERRAMLDTRARIFQAEPSARARRDLMVAHEKVGDLLRLLQRLDDAEPEVQAAMQTARDLADADPADKRAVRDVVRLELTLAALRRAQGRFDEAEALARSALDRNLEAGAGDELDAEQAYLTARAREGVARSIHGLAPARAVKAYGETLRAYASIATGDERNALIESQRSAVELALGAALADAGRTGEAIQQLGTVLSHIAALGPDDELTYEVRLEVLQARERLAELQRPSP
jgi:serine/threonine protein kinase